MGYLVGNRCVGTVADAADLYYSTTRPALTPGTTTYESYYSFVGSSWQQCRSQISSTGVRSSSVCVAVGPIEFRSCAPEAFFADGVLLGWSVAGALVAAWGVVKVRELLR